MEHVITARSRILLGLLFLMPLPLLAQGEAEEFYKGEVVEVLSEQEGDLGLGGNTSYLQELKIKFLEGPRQDEEVQIEYGGLSKEGAFAAGDKVVLVTPESNVEAYIFDKYRLPALGWIGVIFVALAVLFAGWRGLTSLVGLGVSVLVLIFFAVPRIMAGSSPLLISLAAAAFIAVVSIYLAHGFNRRTSVAVVSTLVTVALSVGVSHLFVEWAGLLGVGSEEAFYLQTSVAGFVNLKGLLLGGITIGVLGVLDDITTSQAAAVDEIYKANLSLTKKELFKRGQSVGKEHITSLVNTLALAYVGASFPALLLFTVYQRPWWVVANTEVIAEEIVRTLVGSAALMVAVPITTWIAVQWLTKPKAEESTA